MVFTFGAAAAENRTSVPGPIDAQVIEVLDGDTIRVRAHIWPNQQVETLVRVEGVNTPELKAQCPAERELSLRATYDLINTAVAFSRALRRLRTSGTKKC